jgi:peptidoglycan-N-acetylglucosamine deacetylase
MLSFASPTRIGIFASMTLVAPHYHKAKKNAFIRFFQRDHFFVKTPGWLKMIYPECTWNVTTTAKEIYLSFDDGPHPTITPFVLDQLARYNARATFFCVGDNVRKFPGIYQQVISGGHTVGNHTQHHVNGWKIPDEEYLQEITEASAFIPSLLFRPPYGRMRKSQIRLMKQRFPGIKIIMWNVLAGDWVQDLPPEKCLEKIKNRINPGDIILFHDSEKAFPRLEYVLPKLLADFSEKGFTFKSIS